MKKYVQEFLLNLGDYVVLLGQTLAICILGPFHGKGPKTRHTLHQMVAVGVESLGIVCLVVFFVGLVIAMQTAYEMVKMGSEMYVGRVVGLTMLRELGPLIATIVLGGRSGAAIAAELGTMKVTEQLDALRAMGTAPVDYLAVPRFIALLIGLPLLTADAMAFGIGSGYVVAVRMLHIDSAYFLANMYKFTALQDVTSGLGKSVCFAVFIALVSCYKGFTAGEGAEGVGRATTQAVVVSSLTVLIANFFIAVMFNTLSPP